jgi:FtsP/CotA-like multicopper oxidase with cupredoxin domain
MRFAVRLGMILFALCAAAVSNAADDSSLPAVLANDNRTPGGQLKNGVLNLHLELRAGRWYPEEQGGAYRDVYTFAEEGHAPQSSGPLIRVPQGTQIHATLRNTLPAAAKIYGLHRHPGDPKDALTLAPGETREMQFLAGDAGTYLYWATTANHSLDTRDEQETLLSGALVVDCSATKPDDRVFVIGRWSKASEEILSINGKSWPHTERLSYKLGETIHWRILNPTSSDHGMHLHGFYFTVDGVGDGERFERYSQEQRRMGVTERIDEGHVFDMTWTPDREGNWLFHCHMTAHMSPSKSLHPPDAKPEANAPTHDYSAGMGGLILGITVLPGTSAATVSAATVAPHKLQLVLSDNSEKIPSYKLEVNDPAAPPPSTGKKNASLLGPPIVLVRGEPAEIEVKNQSSHPTAIHWHGMELESYYDGVAGWTGSGQQLSPPINPGESFVAHMTPPRAGTFIYHTHWHDDAQLVNGVYGPLIVLEPGQKYDPEHDKTFVFGLGRYPPLGTMLLINGTPEPYPMKLQKGVLYRMRLINITDNLASLRVRLVGNDAPLQWKVIAKDGADLPPAQLKSSVAEMTITVGEAYDVEYQSDHPGEVDLQVWFPPFPVRLTQPLTFVAPQ